MKSLLLFFTCMLGAVMLVNAQKEKSLILQNATIIDGDATVKPRIGSLLIRNGLIKQIVWDKQITPDNNAQVIDCSGKFITPGLMDSHVHLATASMSDQKKAHRSADSILANMIRHGITTVRDMAGDAIFLAEYKRVSEEGGISAPDIFYAAQFAGPGYFKLMGNGRDEKNLGRTPWYRSITETTDLRLAIAEAKGAGVTGIKVYADLSRELIRAITEEARRQGVQVWSHGAVFPSKPSDVVSAGVNSMSHANDLVFEQLPGDTIEIGKAWEQVYKGLKADPAIQDKMLKNMKSKNIFLDPTVFHAENNKMGNAAIITRRAHGIGVKIVAGTDWIYPEGNGAVPLLDEMKLLVEKCGLSNMEALQAATLNGATVTGLNDRGVIREGKRADLLILGTNPANDLNALFTPLYVLKFGRIM